MRSVSPSASPAATSPGAASFFRSAWYLGLRLGVALLAVVAAGCSDSVTGLEADEHREAGLKTVWTHVQPGMDAPSHPPVVVGDSLILFSGHTDLTCLRLADGSVKWSTFVDADVSLLSSVLAVDEARAYATHYDHDDDRVSSIRAWDLRTGREVWRRSYAYGDDGFDIWRGLAVGPDAVYAAGDNGRVFGLDPATGDDVFAVAMSRRYAGFVYHAGVLYGGASWTDTAADGSHTNWARVTAFDGATGDSLWSFTTDAGQLVSVPIVAGDGLYLGLGSYNDAPGLNYLAVDLSRRAAQWQTEDVIAEAHAVAGERVYAREGNSQVTALDRETGTILWRTQVSPFSHGSSTPHYVHGGYLYYPHYEGLYVLDRRDGAVVHAEPPADGYLWEGAVSSSLILAQSTQSVTAYRPYQPGR